MKRMVGLLTVAGMLAVMASFGASVAMAQEARDGGSGGGFILEISGEIIPEGGSGLALEILPGEIISEGGPGMVLEGEMFFDLPGDGDDGGVGDEGGDGGPAPAPDDGGQAPPPDDGPPAPGGPDCGPTGCGG